MSELKTYSAHIFELGCMDQQVYLKSDVDAVIAELNQKLDDAKATAYAESVDAGMREEAHRWALIRNKCLKEAEEYK